MVDSIATKATSTEAVTRIAAATPVVASAPAANPATSPNAVDIAQTSGLASALAASPPVDADRVATIKKAISEGRFPIVPATIADRLIALKLHWKPDDQA